MRRQAFIRATLAAALASTLLAGCNDKPQRCSEAYAHLVSLTRRPAEPELGHRFVGACVAAWDEARVACLMEAKSAGAALACKPKKIRPG